MCIKPKGINLYNTSGKGLLQTYYFYSHNAWYILKYLVLEVNSVVKILSVDNQYIWKHLWAGCDILLTVINESTMHTYIIIFGTS